MLHHESVDMHQSILLFKMQSFLVAMGEALPNEKLQQIGGACNALVFGAMRAGSIDQQQKFFSRLNKIAEMNPYHLQDMAMILKKYKTELTRLGLDKSYQASLDAELASLKVNMQQQEFNARLAGVDTVTLNNNLQRIKKEYQHEIVKIREKHYKIIEQQALSFINQLIDESEFSKDILAEAQDFYAFISLTLAAVAPTGHLLRLDTKEGQPALQSSYMDLLRFLPPDQVTAGAESKEKPLSLQERFSFQFMFKKPELVTALSKCIQPGDRIRMTSTNHVIYITADEDGYTLYDPSSNQKPLKWKTIKELVDDIEVSFIKRFKIKTDMLMVDFTIFERVENQSMNTQNQKEEKINTLLQSILDQRPEDNKGINTPAWDGLTALHLAVAHGNIEMVNTLLARGADPHVAENNGFTPILQAVSNGRVDILEKLLLFAKPDLNINLKMKTGFSAPYVAAHNGYIDMIRKLHNDLRADWDGFVKGGATPLHAAAQNGHLDVVEFLITQAGVDVKQQNLDTGETAAHYAAIHGDIAMLRFLKKHKLDLNTVDKLGRSPLHAAVLNGQEHVVKFLVEECEANMMQEAGNHDTPLHIAIEKGHEDIVRYLAKASKSPSAFLNQQMSPDGNTPVFLAVLKGNVGMVRMLVTEYKVDVNKKNISGDTPIHCTVRRGDFTMFQELVKAGAALNVVNQHGRSVLSVAVRNQHWDIATSILMNTTNIPTELSRDESKALADSLVDEPIRLIRNMDISPDEKLRHFEKILNQENALGKLLASTSPQNSSGYSSKQPQYLLKIKGECDKLRATIAATKAPVEIATLPISSADSSTINHYTPLHIAIEKRNEDIVRDLAKDSKDPSASLNQQMSVDGGSPLFLAVEKGNFVMLEELVKAGAKLDVENKEGLSVLSVAVTNRQLDIVLYILMNITNFSAELNKEILQISADVLINQSIELISKLKISPDEKLRHFEKILKQENALGKLLASTSPQSSSGYSSRQPQYILKIKGECDKLRATIAATKVAANTPVVPLGRKLS